MRLVIIESPYAAPTAAGIASNVDYAKCCVNDSLARGESPIASHLLFTQPGLLDDETPEDRRTGIDAGHAWMKVCDAVVVYRDHGVSPGMKAGIRVANRLKKPVEFRYLLTARPSAGGQEEGLTGR